MVGNGLVFEMYRDGVLESDDEVAVLQGDPPDYQPLTVSLIDMRLAVAQAQRTGCITTEQAAIFTSVSEALPYSTRSWQAVGSAIASTAPSHRAAFQRLASFIRTEPTASSVKTADAVNTLTRLDILTARAPNTRPDWTLSDDWRNRHLFDWQADLTGPRSGTLYVSDGAVIRYQQIYHPDFPLMWTRFGLRSIARSQDAEAAGLTQEGDGCRHLDLEDLTDGALESVARYGIEIESLTAAQIGEWLTVEEAARLSVGDAAVRVLIRSFRPPRGVYDLTIELPQLLTEKSARRAVAESGIVNERVEDCGPKLSMEHLKPSALREHLATVWQVSSTDPDALQAHARDRGFGSLSEALEAVRPYFLLEHARRLAMAHANVHGDE
jgi:hypothetical protein